MNLVLSLYSPYAYKTTWRTTKLIHLLRTFVVSLDSNKRVHGMFTLVISNVQDGFTPPLKSFYWLKTINICSTIDNCSGNTVPSVFLIHTNRWSATINDIVICPRGVRSHEVIELTLTGRINQHFAKWNTLGGTFTQNESSKIDFQHILLLDFCSPICKKKKKNSPRTGSRESHHDHTEELNNWSSDR